jgi:putative membrane-bound dehydrogenase-like protein
MRRRTLLLALLLIAASPASHAADGNRLTYLDGNDPYYVGRDFPKLTTPQWVGEEGVEAVVVLAVDDMTDNIPKYEAFLRPILDRLKRIDGRAPVSIMTCRVDPKDPRLQGWIKEGVNLDVHTLTHPCPLLQKGDFKEAARAYHGCVDLLNQVPGNRPVAFRMPCCDSRNTVSPRFYAEVFNGSTYGGGYLTIDSSVFNVLTPDDPALPRDLVLDADGRERFRKYLPFRSFVNTIEDYPYPYVIGRLCWEFPCVVPSDWEAQNLHKPNNPTTVEDLKAALDAIALKQGVFNLVFHPHGWIKSEQVVELIDHAVAKHGKRVKFLNFREAQERLDKNLLGGQPLRLAEGVRARDLDASKDGRVSSFEASSALKRMADAGRSPPGFIGQDNGARLLDVNGDGYLDVVIGNLERRETRLWNPKRGAWDVSGFPISLVAERDEEHPLPGVSGGVRFGILRPGGMASLLVRDGDMAGAWHFDGTAWAEDRDGLRGLELDGKPVPTGDRRRDRGVRLRDLDGDGCCEILVGNLNQGAAFAWSDRQRRWERLPFAFPGDARVVGVEFRGEDGGRVTIRGADAGLRFVDLDEDGRDDLVFSNEGGYGVYLFESLSKGWSRRVLSGRPGNSLERLLRVKGLPLITRDGFENGFWVHSRHLWWQNEDTAKLPDLVDRLAFNTLLKDVEPRAKSPAASLRSIHVRPGFKVELVASEPLVEDPIAFDWGADGKFWVVEMGDYPLGVDGKGKPGGVVRFLEDTDQDGKYDKATVFLDGLGFPTGILPWRKGVLVACAPDIFYAEDRDGDGKADVREVLFTGFREGNQQHRLNGFDYGLDRWVYGANGDSGGNVRSIKTGKAVGIQGRDFRFRPDDGAFEAESGQTQYGRHRDDWGNWFGNNNPNWAWLYVLADHELRRNPSVPFGDVRRQLDADRRLYPVSRTLARFNDLGEANHVTSANSPTPYRDELFGPAFARSLFVSEPVHNLVHRIDLAPDGAALRGGRPADEADREFLASGDNWFRPTMLKTGPDGALWIADMYRAVIEHPEWIPDDWEAKLDLRAGHDQGRIYRVYPVDKTPRPIPRLDRLDTAGLVAALDSPSGWQRDAAQRLLLHAGDKAAVAPLRRLAAEAGRPKVRVQALWTLAGLGGLSPEVVQKGLADPHPEVRRHAIRAGEGLLGASPALAESVARMADDPDVGVRFQAALSLGLWPDPAAGRALAKILLRDPADPWVRAAVLCSATPHATTILTALFADSGAEGPPAALFEPLFRTAAAQPGARGLGPLVEAVATPKDGAFAAWQLSAAAGLLDALDRGRPAPDVAGRLRGLLEEARRLARDEKAPEDRRLAAVRLLGRPGALSEGDREALRMLLGPRSSSRLQQAAVATFARSSDAKAPGYLLNDWKAHTPALRSAILETLLSRKPWTSELLSALEDGCFPPAEIDPAGRRRLTEHADPEVRRRARALFADVAAGRQEVIDRYRPVLKMAGDATAGAAVFKRACASCHRLGGVGTEVGADLASLTDKSPESLLVAILDPNRAFESKYTEYTVQTADGRVLSGVIVAETATSVTLRRQEGREDVLLRADIEAMAGSGRSLMPEGLEKDLSPKDLADLIAYLAATRPTR